MKVTDIVFDFQTLNNGAEKGILVEVAPYYKYVDGKRTDEQEGYKYTHILQQRDFEKISIKVPSLKPVITAEELAKRNNNLLSRPVNCRCKFYYSQSSKTYCITATADSIELEV